MDHEVVATKFTAVAVKQFGGAANPFGSVTIMPDAVTIWQSQLIPVSMANALVRDVEPLMAQVCGDFAGTL
jgi:hypothetical protein